MNHHVILAWLLDAGTWMGLALLTASVAYGALLLAAPQTALDVSATLKQRYSSRRALRPLEIPRRSEPFFYRHHRIVGMLLLAGVIAFFLIFAFGYPRDTVLAAIANRIGGASAGVLVGTVERFLLVANALIGLFALIVIIRPSALKPLEARANRWISTRRALREADASREPLDAFVASHPRWTGGLILLGTAYIGFSLLVALD